MKMQNYDIVGGFNTIAPGYDRANDAMTFGMHRSWRKQLIKRAIELCPAGGTVLDLATGTGDVALGIAEVSTKNVRVIGVDPAEGMLAFAEQKLKKLTPEKQARVSFQKGDARTLAFPDESVDVVTISWGIRNVLPYSQGLKEIRRVLKPTGHLLVLESGKPEYKLTGGIYKWYSKVIPYIGACISGYKKAYEYYVQSSDEFPGGSQFVEELRKSGYKECSYRTFGLGMVFLCQAQKA